MRQTGRVLDLPPSEKLTPRDLDEDVFEFWWRGGDRAAFAWLRDAHPEPSRDQIAAAVERGHPLYRLVSSFPVTRETQNASRLDLCAAFQRQRPGFSARAYVHAAERVVQCLMSFDRWM